MTGESVRTEDLLTVRKAAGDAPVFINIAKLIQCADGVVVGSGLKIDGMTWNPIDPARVREFMQALRAARE